MTSSLIRRLNQEFGPINWVRFPGTTEIPKGDWIYYETNIIQNKSNLYGIVDDIENDRSIIVAKDDIYRKTTSIGLDIKIDSDLKMILDQLKLESYEVLIYLGYKQDKYRDLHPQPLVWIIKPSISFLKYPNHPHINGNLDIFRNTICYNNTEDILGDTEYEIVIETLSNVNLWLLRHKIWEISQMVSKKNRWIGKHEPYFNENSKWMYLSLINPDRRCRCGSYKTYYECCMQKDFDSYKRELKKRRVNACLEQIGYVDEKIVDRKILDYEDVYLIQKRKIESNQTEHEDFIAKVKDIF